MELISTCKRSQAKGRRAEIELAGLLQERGYNVRPGEPLNFGREADIVGLAGIHCEVKRREGVDLSAALAQAAKDAEFFGDGLPTVFHRGNAEKWTRIAAGVYGTFGDALPIEGLIEAANETAKTGKVTGVLADAINWVGMSEDAFNESLALLGDEGSRAELIMKNLGVVYGETGDSFHENNAAFMESREANLRFQESMSQLAESIQPFLTTLTEMATAFMDWFNGIPDGAQAAVLGVAAFLAVISPIAGIIAAITGALGAASAVSTTFSVAERLLLKKRRLLRGRTSSGRWRRSARL